MKTEHTRGTGVSYFKSRVSPVKSSSNFCLFTFRSILCSMRNSTPPIMFRSCFTRGPPPCQHTTFIPTRTAQNRCAAICSLTLSIQRHPEWGPSGYFCRSIKQSTCRVAELPRSGSTIHACSQAIHKAAQSSRLDDVIGFLLGPRKLNDHDDNTTAHLDSYNAISLGKIQCYRDIYYNGNQQCLRYYT